MVVDAMVRHAPQDHRPAGSSVPSQGGAEVQDARSGVPGHQFRKAAQQVTVRTVGLSLDDDGGVARHPLVVLVRAGQGGGQHFATDVPRVQAQTLLDQ